MSYVVLSKSDLKGSVSLKSLSEQQSLSKLLGNKGLDSFEDNGFSKSSTVKSYDISESSAGSYTSGGAAGSAKLGADIAGGGLFGSSKSDLLNSSGVSINSGYTGVLKLGQSDANRWGIREAVISLDNKSSISTVDITNINSVGLKIGEKGSIAGGPNFNVSLKGVNTVELNAANARAAVNATIDLRADGCDDAVAFVRGSAFSDSFVLSVKDTSHFGWGSSGNVFAALGKGSDLFDSTGSGKSYTTDVVIGGAGADTIKTGAGNDILFGDNGLRIGCVDYTDGSGAVDESSYLLLTNKATTYTPPTVADLKGLSYQEANVQIDSTGTGVLVQTARGFGVATQQGSKVTGPEVQPGEGVKVTFDQAVDDVSVELAWFFKSGGGDPVAEVARYRVTYIDGNGATQLSNWIEFKGIEDGKPTYGAADTTLGIRVLDLTAADVGGKIVGIQLEAVVAPNATSDFYLRSLTFNSNDDYLDGGDGCDLLFGQQGNDVLIGGQNSDVLSGGVGADTFIFNKCDGFDKITDFKASEGDKLDFSDYGLTADAVLARTSTYFGNSYVQLGGDVVVLVGVANLTADSLIV